MIESLGGYRLVRKLGEGSRAAVYLAHPHRDAADAKPAAIKIFHAGANEESVTREAEALSRSAGQHVAQLLDVTRGPDGVPALILSRCANGSVGRLVRERPDLRPGEAITTLAPLVAAVGSLHDAGVTHGAIRPDAVLFDQAGTPTLACFGSAALTTAGMSAAGREGDAGLQADLLALRQLAVVVLELVHDDATADAVQWLHASLPSEQGWLEALSQRLFDLGPPLAVDLRPERAASPSSLPSRLGRAEPLTESAREPGVLAALNMPDFVVRLLPDTATLWQLRTRFTRIFASVRARFWVMSAIAGVLLLLAAVLVPQGVSGASGMNDGAAVPASAADPDATDLTPGSGGGDAESAGESVDADDAIAADEPLAAALALLKRRDLCIRDLSVLCLDGVDQPNSAAAVSDQSLIASIRAGAELPDVWVVQPAGLVVVERLGNSAIVSLGSTADSTPASLLLMKSEAGWRIRSYLPQ